MEQPHTTPAAPSHCFVHTFGVRRQLGWDFAWLGLILVNVIRFPYEEIQQLPTGVYWHVLVMVVGVFGLLSLWVSFVISQDLWFRFKGKPSPPLGFCHVVAGQDGILHIGEGIVGHIKWADIKKIWLDDGLLLLRTEDPDGPSRCVFAPWPLNAEEQEKADLLFRYYLDPQVMEDFARHFGE